jgi:CheY-like chemotaxis protein
VAVVLIVDDEFGIVQVLADILMDYDHQVVSAVNGRQALLRLAEHSVDIVLTDYMMPSLDGPGLLREMRANERYRDIPVILMSSLPPPEPASKEFGFSGFLRKPFRAAAVLKAISDALA